MSANWDVPKSSGKQQKSDVEGLIFIRPFVSFYRRQYFIVCDLHNTQLKQKLRF
jgi:hypothetical protein